MKIILSRKGFDSQYGGYPSPILPDGKMISFPIPVKNSDCTYDDLRFKDGLSYYDIIRQLGIKNIDRCTCCHADPDIYHNVKNRKGGWKPAFGQVDAAEGHLRKQKVGSDDIFLFFGRFSKTQIKNNKYGYYPDVKNQFHALFGYLQIGEIIRNNDFPSWLEDHPHANDSYLLNKPSNTIYIARDKLSWDSSYPGASSFVFSEDLRLTRRKTNNVTEWKLPRNIFGDVRISYHPNPWRGNYFKSASKGQEFVIQDNCKVEEWAKEIIRIGLSDDM
jgi:hypothetical protein